MSPAPVTIAVVSWNTRELLERCLDSLRAEHEAGRCEVWVVDNGSRDGSRELVRERFAWVRLIEPDHNIGYGRAVNLVAENSAGEWLAAANADIALERGAIERLLAAARTNPRAGAIAPRLVLADGATQHSVHPFPTVTVSALVALGLHRASRRLGDALCFEGSWDPDRARAVDWAHGAFLLLRREAFDAARRFDPEQWVYAEDLGLCWRLRRAGWLTLYEPGARVRHEVAAATSQAFGPRREAAHMRAAYAWMARARGMPLTWAYAAVNYLAAAARRVVLAPFAAAGSRRARAGVERARLHMALHRLGLHGRRTVVTAR